jgi:hypothetical protein
MLPPLRCVRCAVLCCPAGATVCPIAIKYNKIFVDAFWNSKRQSFSAHLVRCGCGGCRRRSWAGSPFGALLGLQGAQWGRQPI